jgi:hypothetical protein
MQALAKGLCRDQLASVLSLEEKMLPLTVEWVSEWVDENNWNDVDIDQASALLRDAIVDHRKLRDSYCDLSDVFQTTETADSFAGFAATISTWTRTITLSENAVLVGSPMEFVPLIIYLSKECRYVLFTHDHYRHIAILEPSPFLGTATYQISHTHLNIAGLFLCTITSPRPCSPWSSLRPPHSLRSSTTSTAESRGYSSTYGNVNSYRGCLLPDHNLSRPRPYRQLRSRKALRSYERLLKSR